MPKPTTEHPDFDEEFAKAVAEWRDKHRLRETLLAMDEDALVIAEVAEFVGFDFVLGFGIVDVALVASVWHWRRASGRRSRRNGLE